MSLKALLFCVLFFSLSAQAQRYSLHGKVIDQNNKEPLPFVNIALSGTTQGTASSIEGRFEISVTQNDSLIFTYVGYETFKVSLAQTSTGFLVIELRETSQILNTVEIVAGENPAFKIIRAVIKNRKKNDPENLSSFSYKAYHKFYATAEGENDLPSDTTRFAQFIKSNHLFLNETFSERKYISPNFDNEIVLGNRMSGVKDPFFAILATNFQPFSFYKEHITLLDKNYLNPITPGSFSKYDFELSDTVYRGSDITFIILFKPLEGKTFDGLAGALYVNTNGYALEHVLAETYDEKALMTVKVQQKYKLTNGHWFPEQLNTEFVLTQNKIADRNIKYVHRSYLSEIEINSTLDKKDFANLNVAFDPAANKQGDEYWERVRLDSLSGKERNTYQLYDSLGKHNRLATLNFFIKTLEAVAVGKFKAGAFYIPVENLVRVNKYEDFRFGFGLETGEKISRHIVADAYMGYGVKDKAFKYGGSLQFNFNRKKEFYLKFLYRQDIQEPGLTNFIKSPPLAMAGQGLRNWLAFRMDSIQQFKAMVHLRPFRFSQVVLFIEQRIDNPAYSYRYVTEDIASEEFINTEFGLQWRFALRENTAQIAQQNVVTNFAVPHINLLISKSLRDVWDGQFTFTKAEIKFDYNFITRFIGKTSFQVAAGLIDGNAPYPLLFNGRGARFEAPIINGFIVPNYFQTMGLYEFVSDRYVNFFFTQNFGRITGTQSRYFRPELSITQNTGLGKLHHPEYHHGIEFNTMEKGYFESGVVVTNIVRFKYLNVIYFGLGGGAFYRYGNYRLPSVQDNFSFNVMVTGSF